MNKTYIFFSILFLISIALAQNEESGTADTVNYIHVSNATNTTNQTNTTTTIITTTTTTTIPNNITIVVRDPTTEEVIEICRNNASRCPVDIVTIVNITTVPNGLETLVAKIDQLVEQHRQID